MQEPWYDRFFDDAYLALEAERLSPPVTAREVDGILAALAPPPEAALLDLCCGSGRHLVALAQRGYRMTGLDRSATMLDRARAALSAAGAEAELVHADMREIPAGTLFDGIYNVFFAWGYLEDDGENQAVLHAVAHRLKSGGRFFLEYVNRELVLRHLQQTWRERPDGARVLRDYSFDPVSSLLSGRILYLPPGADAVIKHYRVRLYTCTEILGMLAEAGLRPLSCFGSFQGESYTLNSPALLVVAEKV